MPGRDEDTAEHGQHPPLKVVVVDDDPTIRMLLARHFGADPRFSLAATASNGHQAVEAVAAAQPDLVLLDVSMPVMDGIAAATLIRACSAAIHIVMCSADQHRRREAIQAGADLWIDKPIDYRRLSAKLLAATTPSGPAPDPEDS